MFANGSSLDNGSSMGSSAANTKIMSESRNTEPWFWRLNSSIQHGAFD
jgi:hypothetical protein